MISMNCERMRSNKPMAFVWWSWARILAMKPICAVLCVLAAGSFGAISFGANQQPGAETKPASRPDGAKPESRAAKKLEAGDKAPAFKVKDHTGKERTLEEFKGKRVVLYFYPKADTPGCTAESCAFRDK